MKSGRTLRPHEKRYLDIGAGLGYYSLLAASRGYKVTAFEPLPRLSMMMNVSLCVLEHNKAIKAAPVHLHNAGLAEREQRCYVVLNGKEGGQEEVRCAEDPKVSTLMGLSAHSSPLSTSSPHALTPTVGAECEPARAAKLAGGPISDPRHRAERGLLHAPVGSPRERVDGGHQRQGADTQHRTTLPPTAEGLWPVTRNGLP